MTGLDFSERRLSPRLVLKAYGFDHLCELRLEGRAVPVHLVDVSQGGARLRLAREGGEGLSAAPGQDCHLSLGLVGDEDLVRERRASVRWIDTPELGVEFTRPLERTAHDIQRLLDKVRKGARR